MSDHSNRYNDESFWEKLLSVPPSAGCTVIRKALTLYCLMKSEDVPLALKAAIVSALGYFIWPLDVVPDFIPFVGYGDDLGVMVAVLAGLSAWVDAVLEAEVEALMPDVCL